VDTSESSPGLLNSLRQFGGGLLASVQDRLELVSLELQEEKLRLIQTFILISAAFFAGAMALTFASLTLVYLFWDTARFAVLGGLALIYAVAAVAICIALRRFLARQPRPFAATIDELKQDRECISKED
jgi:uncharacterized membrane protein YqjE